MAEQSDLTSLLGCLATSGTAFVLVGALAAVAQGVPITTFDIDIVPQRTPENIDRLIQVLGGLHAATGDVPGPLCRRTGARCSGPVTLCS